MEAVHGDARIGVGALEVIRRGLQSRLLAQLPPGRLGRRLPLLDPARDAVPVAALPLRAAEDEELLAAADEDEDLTRSHRPGNAIGPLGTSHVSATGSSRRPGPKGPARRAGAPPRDRLRRSRGHATTRPAGWSAARSRAAGPARAARRDGPDGAPGGPRAPHPRR